MSDLPSYGKIYNLGHRQLGELLAAPVVVEEKVDGSQFSFGVREGVLHCRSKGRALDLDEPQKLFSGAVDTCKGLHNRARLKEGWTYRGEVLQSPRHNTLEYARVPIGHIAIFDIDTADQCYLNPDEKEVEAASLGLETVPCVYKGMLEHTETIKALMERESFLGKATIEGLVIKQYARFSHDGKALMGKHVSEKFKEKHGVAWKNKNPGGKDIVAMMVQMYKHTNRWEKSLQHLREDGSLEGTPRDIGKIVKAVQADVRVECEEEIKEALFKWAWPNINRGIVRGLPEYYKETLMAAQFKGEENGSRKEEETSTDAA